MWFKISLKRSASFKMRTNNRVKCKIVSLILLSSYIVAGSASFVHSIKLCQNLLLTGFLSANLQNIQSSVIPQLSTTTSHIYSQPASINSSTAETLVLSTPILNESYQNATNDLHPRRLTSLPKGRSNRKLRLNAPESAINRARLLLGSMNRQNCFAKVLCGLGAKEPTTKTGLMNDYVYLMEELLTGDDDTDTKSDTKKWGKGKKKKKVHTKKDDDDSASSQSEEMKLGKKDDTDIDPEDALTDFGFLADASLAQEDPQVLTYMKLEERRRKLKNGATHDFLLRRRRRSNQIDYKNNTTRTIKTLEETVYLQLPPKSNLRLARQMAEDIKAGRTFGGTRRQCRTIFNNGCPFDDTQMNEIIGNLKKMLTGRGPAASSGNSPSGSGFTAPNNAFSQAPVAPQAQPGSKVEITLHLNQNGMPYGGGYPMMPMAMPYMPQMHQYHQPQPVSPPLVTADANSTPVQVNSATSPPLPQWPQLTGHTDPRYPYQGMGYPYPPPPPPTTTEPPKTTTTTTPRTTTVRTAGEEQLLDFLYGVVSFNESADTPAPVPATKDQASEPIAVVTTTVNPYWSVANAALDKVESIDHQLKIRNKEIDEDESISSASNEEEFKLYIKTLKETLQGLSQVTNANATATAAATPVLVPVPEKEILKSSEEDFPLTLADAKEIFKSSEENSSPEDVPFQPTDDDFVIPELQTVVQESEESEESDELKLQKQSTEEQKTKVLNKQPTPKPTQPTPTKTVATTEKSNKLKPEVPLFDDDDTDNAEPTDQIIIRDEHPENDKVVNEDLSESVETDSAEQETNDENSPENISPESMSRENNSPENESHKYDDLYPEEHHKLEPKEEKQHQQKPKEKESESLRPQIHLKFEPMSSDSGEMSEKDKEKLMALSNALLPQVPQTQPVNPKKKPVKAVDIVEEIRLPTSKPLRNEFQNVADIVKDKVISIDEFADDNPKSPIFPKKQKRKGAPHRFNYQNKRKPAMTSPVKQPDRIRTDNSGSSEEDDDNPDREGPVEKNKGPGMTLISVPSYRHPYHRRPVHPSESFLGGVMNFMGMKPVSKTLKHVPTSPTPGMQYGYPINEEQEQESYLTKAHLIPQPKIGISIPIDYDMSTTTKGRDGMEAEKKDEEEESKDKKEKGKKDKKKKEKDKKKKKKKKKKGKKKGEGGGTGWSQQFHQQIKYTAKPEEPGLWDKIKEFVDVFSNTQKAAEETPFIHVGFSENYPLDGGPHAVIQDNIAHAPVEYAPSYHGSSGGGSSEDTDEEDEEDDLADEQDVEPPPPASKTKEQDDILLDLNKSVSVPEYEGIEYDDENDDESNESSNTSQINASQIPGPTPAQPTKQTGPWSDILVQKDTIELQPTQRTTTTTTTTTTKRTTIAPKPPKYAVNRQKLRVKQKQKKHQQVPLNTTSGPPIMLIVPATKSPPTKQTTKLPQPSVQQFPRLTTTHQPTSKPPKRRIIYKPPAKPVNVNISPGIPLHQVTLKPTTTQSPTSATLKPIPSSINSVIKDLLKSKVEDDEIEPPSHFFQPGPNGQNIRGRPPIPIHAFHIQSEDMLSDSLEDKKLRTGIVRQGPSPPFFKNLYGLQTVADSGSASVEGSMSTENDPESGEQTSGTSVSFAAPSFNQTPALVETIHSPEETRGTRVRIKRRRRPNSHMLHYPSRPQYSYKINNSHYPNQFQPKPSESSIKTTVMNSPIFSDYFKHIYTKFENYFSSLSRSSS